MSDYYPVDKQLGLDSKVTNSALIRNMTFTAYGAPTHTLQPAFVWSKIPISHPCANLSHILIIFPLFIMGD